MNIQKFSELVEMMAKIEALVEMMAKIEALVEMMAKIEAKREELQDLNNRMDILTDEAAANNFIYDDESRDNYLSAYDSKKKAERSLKKVLNDFRKAVESDEETAFYANQCKYSINESDLAYYDRVKWNIMKDATNVRFGNYKYTF